jgi:polyhydroxyalkanoate synthesis regulator phasin
MKSTKTSLVILFAAAMLVGATGAVMATSGAPAAPEAQVPAAATPTPAPTASARVKDKGVPANDVLAGVLDDLVAKGTLTDAQKQAVLDGVKAERTARADAKKAARAQAKADRQQLKDFLADGVITKEEFDKLPANSPMRTLTTLMDDGKITADELKALRKGWPGGVNGNRGWGKGGRGANPAPSASPSTGG